MPDSLFLAMSSPAQGQEDDHARWYDDVHLPEVLGLDGVAAGQRFVLGADQMPEAYTPACPYSQAAFYEVSGDSGGVARELARRAEDGTFDMFPAIAARQGSFYEPRTALLGGPHDEGDDALLIFTAPGAGHAPEAYHAWYEETHLGEVLEVPGIRTARRWHVSGAPMPDRLVSPPPHPDLAVYRTSAPAAEVAAELERRFVEGVFTMSPVLDMTSMSVWFFSPATSRRTAPAAAQAR
ncbi:MAG: hypothetical protein JWQ20_3016 [Conexibacter sp.]|nr:hypothetical protein [Conexibacter sp.]